MKSDFDGVKLWVKGDWNGFFGLFTNNLTNLMVLAGILRFGLKMPEEIVYGRIMPALGLTVFCNALYYFWMGARLGRSEKRLDVTSLPSGVSVPHMFIIVFMIMGPVYFKTKDAVMAWQVGLAWCFIEAIVAIIGAFIGPWLRSHTPRAAMLGTLAGVSICLISMRPAMQSWEVPYIAFVSLTIILIGFIGRQKMPGNIPAGLLAIVAGTAIGWLTGYMHPQAVAEAAASVKFSWPLPSLSALVKGFHLIAPYIASAIPLGIYNFFESMDNLESASAAGDNYNTREAMLVDGFSSLLGSLVGSPFPIAIYIGHAGWKSVGARIGYSLASGVCVLLVCFTGIIPLLLSIIPLVALVPLLLYIGLAIGAQAFQASPSRHAPAVVIGMVPWLANWGQTLIDNALSAAGTSAHALGYAKLMQADVIYRGMEILGAGAIIVGMLLAAITAYIIDNRYREATYFAIGGAVLSFFGIIHATKIGLGTAMWPAVGYLLMAAIFLVMSRFRPDEEEGGVNV